MHESTTTTLEGADVGHPAPPEKFSFIRAAAGFVLHDAPEGGVFTGPPASTPGPSEPATVDLSEPVHLPPVANSKSRATPFAHRLMMLALIPFVVIAVSGIIVINRPTPRHPQPAPAPTATTVPVTAAPAEPAPPPAPPTTVYTPAPVVRTTGAPRVVSTTPTTQPPASTTASTEVPTTTTEPPATTPTTEPPATTPTTEPPATTPTTEPPSSTPLTEQP
ncbi:MAG TPA: hypothetical protein VMZ51_03425 [Acidimicrobiales bacterium]|nr:hypothetical protein [Acidimicrobiales bacterium]